MNPPFPIIPVGVFMREKLITCDKYTGAWTRCHFCQAACEQKHFSNAVILAMALSDQPALQQFLLNPENDVEHKKNAWTPGLNVTQLLKNSVACIFQS